MTGKSAIHRYACLGMTLILLFASPFCLAGSQYPLLKESQLSLKRLQAEVRIKPEWATERKLKGGGVEFVVRGDADARSMWAAPVDLAMKTTYTIAFTVHCDNLTALARRPNVFIRLTPLQKGRPGRDIPVYTTSGDGEELGRVSIDLSTQVPSRAELVVDLSTKVAGQGKMTLKAFSISYDGNLETVDRDVLYAKSTLKTAISNGTVTLMMESLPLRAVESKGVKTVDGATLKDAGFAFRRVIVDESLWRVKGFFERDALKTAIDVGPLPVLLEIHLAKAPAWWTTGLKKEQAVVSDFNPEWRTFCTRYLEQLFAALESQGLDQRVPIVTVVTGAHGGRLGPMDRDGDVNVTTAYRNWLKESYGSIEKLRSEWRDPDISFDAVRWVPKERWPRAAIGPIVVGSLSPRLRDCMAFYHASHVGFTLDLCKTVKTLSKSRVLCGAVWHPLELDPLWDNQFYPDKDPVHSLESSEAVDFIELAYPHTELSPLAVIPTRKPVMARVMARTIDDLRLSACGLPREIDGLSVSAKAELLSGTETAKMMSLLWKVVAAVQSTRQKTPAEVAFVYDPTMFSHVGPERTLPVPTTRQQSLAPVAGCSGPAPNGMHVLYALSRKLWSMSGLPYDVVAIDSLTKKSPYKVLIFAPVLELTKEHQNRLSELRKGGRTLIWSWASGLLADGKLKPTAIGHACDLSVKFSTAPHAVTMQPTKAMKGFLGEQRLYNMLGAVRSPFDPKAGLAAKFSPSFSVNDPKATILAVGTTSKQPAIAMRKFFRWTSVYTASPIINPEIVRACALKSSVHVYYSYNEPSLVTDRFILISPATAGVRSVDLPKKSPLLEVFSGMSLPAAKRQEFKVKQGRTYLFFRGDDREWQTLLDASLSNK